MNWQDVASVHMPDIEWSNPKGLALPKEIISGVHSMASSILMFRDEVEQLREAHSEIQQQRGNEALSNIARLAEAEEILRLREENATIFKDASRMSKQIDSGECCDGAYDKLTHSEAKRRALRENVSRHVQYLRNAEEMYRKVGKEKYSWSKLNGPLSAIERDLAADAAEDA